MISGRRTGMHFSGINKDDAASRRYVLTPAISKLFRALFNDAYRVALVRMGCEGMRHIRRVKQFEMIQCIVMPEFDVLRGAHSSPFSLSSDIPYETILKSSAWV